MREIRAVAVGLEPRKPMRGDRAVEPASRPRRVPPPARTRGLRQEQERRSRANPQANGHASIVGQVAARLGLATGHAATRSSAAERRLPRYAGAEGEVDVALDREGDRAAFL